MCGLCKPSTGSKHPHHVIIEPKQKAGFYSQETANGTWITYILPTANFQIQISQQEKVREHLALELAGSVFALFVDYSICFIGLGLYYSPQLKAFRGL